MSTPAPLGLVVLSGDWARVHYALMMASSAAAIDRLIHHSVILELNNGSYRMEQAKQTKQAGKEDKET